MVVGMTYKFIKIKDYLVLLDKVTEDAIIEEDGVRIEQFEI